MAHLTSRGKVVGLGLAIFLIVLGLSVWSRSARFETDIDYIAKTFRGGYTESGGIEGSINDSNLTPEQRKELEEQQKEEDSRGFFARLFGIGEKEEAAENTEPSTTQVSIRSSASGSSSQTQTSSQPPITYVGVIEADHTYNPDTGSHTISGAIDVDSRCNEIFYGTQTRSDGVLIHIVQERVTSDCVSGKVSRRFSVSFKAEADVKVQAIYEGEYYEVDLR